MFILKIKTPGNDAIHELTATVPKAQDLLIELTTETGTVQLSTKIPSFFIT